MALLGVTQAAQRRIRRDNEMGGRPIKVPSTGEGEIAPASNGARKSSLGKLPRRMIGGISERTASGWLIVWIPESQLVIPYRAYFKMDRFAKVGAVVCLDEDIVVGDILVLIKDRELRLGFPRNEHAVFAPLKGRIHPIFYRGRQGCYPAGRNNHLGGSDLDIQSLDKDLSESQKAKTGCQ